MKEGACLSSGKPVLPSPHPELWWLHSHRLAALPSAAVVPLTVGSVCAISFQVIHDSHFSLHLPLFSSAVQCV